MMFPPSKLTVHETEISFQEQQERARKRVFVVSSYYDILSKHTIRVSL